MKIPGFLFLLIIGFCTACSTSINTTGTDTPGASSSPTLRVNQTDTAASVPTVTVSPTFIPAALPPAAIPSSTPSPGIQVCSPLAGIQLEALNDLIVNDYTPPEPGSDDPHQAVDFAILDKEYQFAISGHPVQSVLEGKVAAVIQDRFPYGNAVMIETELSQLTPIIVDQINIPTPGPNLLPHPSLTCPETGLMDHINSENRSLFVLYAHLQSPPAFKVGDSVKCGDFLGTIGDSGNALNPHLHLEARIGPSGFPFPGLAHYETRAKPEEMEAYCLWRVSGAFQLVHPIKILTQ